MEELSKSSPSKRIRLENRGLTTIIETFSTKIYQHWQLGLITCLITLITMIKGWAKSLESGFKMLIT